MRTAIYMVLFSISRAWREICYTFVFLYFLILLFSHIYYSLTLVVFFIWPNLQLSKIRKCQISVLSISLDSRIIEISKINNKCKLFTQKHPENMVRCLCFFTYFSRFFFNFISVRFYWIQKWLNLIVVLGTTSLRIFAVFLNVFDIKSWCWGEDCKKRENGKFKFSKSLKRKV